MPPILFLFFSFIILPITKHPFHIVSPSPWPLLSSLSAFLTLAGLLLLLQRSSSLLFLFGLAVLALTTIRWFCDITHEATYLGQHTLRVQSSLRLGFLLFIVSEVFFFVSFFWAYLHFALSPSVELGSCWPPPGITPLNAFGIPLLNTFILLTSGLTVTCAHSCLLSGMLLSWASYLSSTLFLGLFFTVLQGFEYFMSGFCISDGSYGSSFYLSTGFHGLHVLLGALFLAVSLARGCYHHFSPTRHCGFAFACWYWHFVDVVWLLLFSVIYVWGS